MRLGPYCPEFAAPGWGWNGLWCNAQGVARLVERGLVRQDQWRPRALCVADAGLRSAQAVFERLAYYTGTRAKGRFSACEHSWGEVFELLADPVECALSDLEVDGRKISITAPLADGGDIGWLVVDGDPGFGVGLPPRLIVSVRAAEFLMADQPGWFTINSKWIGIT